MSNSCPRHERSKRAYVYVEEKNGSHTTGQVARMQRTVVGDGG
jgi:hypothetical protein